MKGVLFFLFFSAVVAFLGLLYLFTPGVVTITALNYEIQFSVIFGFFILIGLLFLISIFSRIIFSLYSFVVCLFSFFRRSKKKVEQPQSSPSSLP